VKLLLAPDKFKGCLSASAAAKAFGQGWQSVCPETELLLAPIADGGEGFSEALATALQAEWVQVDSVDAIGRPISCRVAWVPETRTAVIEMSEASGLNRLQHSERDPRRANTFGTGLLIRDAALFGAKRILLGLGGSATTDGGIGMAAALGFQFLSADGEVLEPIPANFPQIAKIDSSSVYPLPEIIAACDVQNPLLGQRGTAAVFAPQKGADEAAVRFLEGGLTHLSKLVERDLNCSFSDTPGAGAAGGIGFGLLSLCKAVLRPGFELVAETVGFDKLLAQADLVVTGEGSLDAQTLEGKGPLGVARLARAAGKPVVAFAGFVEEDQYLLAHFDAVFPIIDRIVSFEQAMKDAPEFIHRAAARAARLISNPILL
jgi:glycerate kinase